MPLRTVKDALVLRLENLTHENLDRFREKLLDRRGEPQVRRNQVENKGPLVIANVMVSAFTEPGVSSVAEEILKDLGLSDEANRLAGDVAALSSGPGPTARPSTGEAGADARAAELFLKRHHSELIKRVTNVPTILDDLLFKVIQQEQYDGILRLSPTQVQMRELLSIILKAPLDRQDCFYTVLKKNEPYLVNELESKNELS